MGLPTVKPTMWNALSEMSGASSSLHMFPEPLENALGNELFLDESDKWAKHSAEHISAASQSLSKSIDALNALISKIYWNEAFAKDNQLTVLQVAEQLKSILR